MNKIAVIGAGSWGTAVAALLAGKKKDVTLWGRNPELIDHINRYNKNPTYLENLRIPERLIATADIAQAVSGKELIIMAIPSHAIRQTLELLSSDVRDDAKFISLIKGIEIESLSTMSAIIADELKIDIARIAVLSGPNHAEEVAKSIPSATVIASTNSNLALELQDLFMKPSFRVYTNSDVLGVELGGALKNIIAIAAGVSDGLGFGDNTKASLMTRGLAEMTRFGMEMGASPFTFFGLSGIGDLIVTCASKYSRNRLVGERIGKGEKLKEIVSSMTMVAEGISTSKAIKKLAGKRGIELPICEQVYAALYEDKNPYDCVNDLMTRGATNEVEQLINYNQTVKYIDDNLNK